MTSPLPLTHPFTIGGKMILFAVSKLTICWSPMQESLSSRPRTGARHPWNGMTYDLPSNKCNGPTLPYIAFSIAKILLIHQEPFEVVLGGEVVFQGPELKGALHICVVVGHQLEERFLIYVMPDEPGFDGF